MHYRILVFAVIFYYVVLISYGKLRKWVKKLRRIKVYVVKRLCSASQLDPLCLRPSLLLFPEHCQS